MYLKEFEGSAVFAKYGIPIPVSCLITEQDFSEEMRAFMKIEDFLKDNSDVEQFAVKAQLLRGHRGKSGGVIFASKDQLVEKVFELKEKRFEGVRADEILIVKKIEIESELYLAVVVDRFHRCPKLIFSMEGGIDIEDISEKSPEKIHELEIWNIDDNQLLNFFNELNVFSDQLIIKMVGLAKNLIDLFNKEDAILAEINPLVILNGDQLMALDSKIIIDDSALYRHTEYQEISLRSLSMIEKEAYNNDLSYVELDGDLAIVGNGAGLVMATLDSVKQHGGSPANFCDIGGGATRKMMFDAIQIVLHKESIKGLFINIFGGITHCDEIALGIVDYLKETKKTIPMVVRIVGTNEKDAMKILEEENIKSYVQFNEAVKAAALLNK